MQPYDSLHIEHEWTTPIGNLRIYLPDALRQVLISILVRHKNISTQASYNSTSDLFDAKTYNLFDHSDKSFTDIEKRCLIHFETIASELIRTYVKKAWGWDESLKIKARCFGNVQRPFSRRTAPHHHHGWDGVFVHYLTIGEEFNYPDFSDKTNENLKTITSRAKKGREMLDAEDSTTIHTDHSRDLLLLDPRPSIRMPYNNKAKVIKPEVGTTLLHPAYLYHETETHTKPGIRVAIVINFNIENPNYDTLPTYLT